MILEKKGNALWLLGVWLVFVISRILLDAMGIEFHTETLFSWHIIDLPLLREDLWRSVFYLHSQPPLLNIFIGIVLQIFPENYEAVFHVFYYLTGIILAGAIYYLGLSMRFPNWLAATLSAWFMLSPATILFEHWLTYTYPLVAALTFSGICLYQFVKTKRKRWGAAFFFLLAGMSMTWSLFHLIWLLGVVAILYFVWGERKKVVLAALLPVLFVIGWYSKNAVIAGDFSASSWAGMNLSKIVTFRISEKERKQMVKAGRLSQFALIPPFRNPNIYLKILPNTPKTGIPILDNAETSLSRRNHHHLVYAEASRYYLKDALLLIYLKPGVYARSVIQAIYIYFHSPSDYEFLTDNRAHIEVVDQIWNRAFYGQWQTDSTATALLNHLAATHVGWLIVVSFVTALIGGVNFLRKNRERLAEPLNLLILFMIYNILFVSIVGVTMDIGENNRFRWVVDPFLMVLFVFVIRNIMILLFKSPFIGNQNLIPNSGVGESK